MLSRFLLGDAPHDLWLSREGDAWRLHVADDAVAPLVALERGALVVDGVREPVVVTQAGDALFVHLDGRTFALRYCDPVALHGAAADDAAHAEARAPMPGTVVAVHRAAGDAVAAGESLLVIESMKLETTIRAARAGVVERVHVAAGQTFDRDQILVTLAAAE